MPAFGPRHARGPLPSPIRPSKRPLPIHGTRRAAYGGLTTRVPQASCRTVPSAQADEPMPVSGPRHARGPLPSPIRPSKRPLPIHRVGPRHGANSGCGNETHFRPAGGLKNIVYENRGVFDKFIILLPTAQRLPGVRPSHSGPGLGHGRAPAAAQSAQRTNTARWP